MTRSDRLFRLLETLRRLPPPCTAAHLAAETGVSVRSIYRDIESLRAGGAEIGGERGVGYTLVDDGRLRPQTFSRIEIEALTLGLAEVQNMGDPALATAARAVLAKVAATLPSLGQQHALHAVSQVRRMSERYPTLPDMDLIRACCWREEALEIAYLDRDGAATSRTIWPLAIVYLDRVLMLLARCCLRDDFRMFSVERIGAASASGASFRPRRVALLREYQARLADTKSQRAPA